MNISPFQHLGNTIDTYAGDFMSPAITRVMEAMDAPIIALLAAYLICKALLMGARIGNHSAGSWGVEAFKITIVYALVSQFGNYQHYVIGTINDLQTVLGAAVSGSDSGASIYDLLDRIASTAGTAGVQAFAMAKDAGFISNTEEWGAWIAVGLCAYIGGLAVTMAAGFAILGAKLMIMMLLIVGPVFLAGALFPWTSKFSIAWLSALLTQTVKIILISVAAIFTTAVMRAAIDDVDINGGESSPFAMAGQLLVIVLAMIYTIYQLSILAANLAGGISTQVMTASAMLSTMRPLQNAANSALARGAAKGAGRGAMGAGRGIVNRVKGRSKGRATRQ